MKKFIPLLLLLLPLSIFAQDTTAFKGAKQIVVKTDLPAAEGYKQVVMALLDAGYFLDQKDESLFIAKTQEKNYPKGGASFFINVRAKDNEVILSGQCTANMEVAFGPITGTKRYFPIEFRTNNKVMKGIFQEMEAIAVFMQKPRIYL